MKKLLLKIFALLTFAMISPEVIAQVYRLDVDHASNVTVDIDGTVYDGIKDGLNEIEMGGALYLRVIANEGVLFTEVTVVNDFAKEETDIAYQVESLPDGRRYIDFHASFPEDEWFRVRTQSATEARSASFTVSIDDPSKAQLMLKDVPVALTVGDNVIEFEPASESVYEVVPQEYTSIYSLTLNGVEVDRGDSYRYSLKVADGDHVVITTQYPDRDCAVSFTLTGDDVSDFIREVDVNGRPELNWNKEGFTVKCGSVLTLRGRTDEYEVMTFAVNGAPETFSSEVSLFITEDTEIVVDVRKYASFKITIVVDDPERVAAYRGYINDNFAYELQPGENTVEILRKNPFFTLKPADGCYIKSLTVTGQEDYSDEELTSLTVQVPVVDNDVVNVVTADIVRDQNAMVFVHNSSAAGEDFSMRRADTTPVELADGYNEVPFFSRDNDFVIKKALEADTRVYLNEEPVEVDYAGYNFYATLADGDVLKIFYDFAPQAHAVKLTADTTLDDVEVVADHIRAVDAAEFTALTHTHIAIAPKGESVISVAVNGEPVEADADGHFVLTADADKAIHVTHISSAITEITAPTAGRGAYDLQGRRASASARGLLIIDGSLTIKK